MRRIPRWSLTISLLAAGSLAALSGCARKGPGGPAAPPPEIQALVGAERAFAADAAAKGIRAAFLAWLADDAVLFRPRIISGRSYCEQLPANSPAVLAWEPVYAAVARSGDFGYTTGPWTWRDSPRDTANSWGDYVSVWRKLPDGSWRVAIDLGVPHAKPAGPPPALSYPGDGRPQKAAARGEVGAESEVRAAEAAFDARAAAAGADSAYLDYGSPALRLYRAGEEAVLGPQRAAAVVKRMDATVRTIRQMGARISRDGDLGCVWGETDGTTGRGNPGLSTWLRIWSRDATGAWRLMLDISLIVPLEPPRE